MPSLDLKRDQRRLFWHINLSFGKQKLAKSQPVNIILNGKSKTIRCVLVAVTARHQCGTGYNTIVDSRIHPVTQFTAYDGNLVGCIDGNRYPIAFNLVNYDFDPAVDFDRLIDLSTQN
jgi:hypothetical protein